MELLQTTLQLARDFRATALLKVSQRQRWTALLEARRSEYWPEACASSSVVLDRRVRSGAGGLMVRGVLAGAHSPVSFWIKWCPEADPAALEQSIRHMRWWSSHYPKLARSVPKLIDCWPDEKVLLIEGVKGVPVGRLLQQDSPPMHTAIRSLARWHRAYVDLGQEDVSVIDTLLGSEVYEASGGHLHVRADRLIERRIALAGKSAHQLPLAGCNDARQWADRYDLSGIVSQFVSDVSAGFVHGDFKPDNVLINGETFSVIDWWTAPRISWPLADVAVFAANLWMDPRREEADRVWQTFVRERFLGKIDARDQHGIDLLAAMTCLGYLANRCKSTRSFDRVYCRRVLHRLLTRRYPIGRVIPRSQLD